MNRRFWTALSAFALVATGAVLAPAVTANASEPETTAPRAIPKGCSTHGDIEVCLSDPTTADGGSDKLIENRLRELTASAKEGDSIRVAMYTWTRKELAAELVAAKDRGVDVKVVLDGVNKQDNTGGYSTLTAGKVPVTNCDPACLGTNINHTKYFLSEIGGTKSVVVTSSNMTTTQTTLFNNLLKVDNDAKLYGFYLGFWERMNAQSWTHDGTTWGDGDKQIVGDSGAAGYAYPRKGDNMLWMLDSITDCSADGDGDGDADNTVWVSASLFTSPRVGIRNRLNALEGMGCDVRVIVENTDTEAWVEAGGLTKSKVVTVAKSHNKLFIVDAKYLGKWDEVTFSGSHNLTGTSLETNDEVILRVSNPEVTKLYQDYHSGLIGSVS